MRSLLTIVFTASISQLSFGQTYPIGSRSITFTDPDRNNRSIPTDIYYPAVSAGSNAAVAEGEFPVVVFGHGFAMTVNAYQNWWEHLVPLGYIVALPKTEGGSIFNAPNHGAFGLDLAFLAQRIQADNDNPSSPFNGHVRQRAALIGHSMGGGASFLGGAGNTNIRCIVGLAPAETNPPASEAAANVTVPTLILHGTSDNVTPEDEHALLIHNGLQNSCRNYVRIDNGAHCYFANSNFECDLGENAVGGGGSLSRIEQQQVSFAVTEPWLRYFLFDDCSAFNDFVAEMGTNPDLGTNIYGCPNEAPIISENQGVLQSTAAPNYQWYLNGEPIDGQTAQQHTYTGAGSYQVGTINVGTCPVFSNTIVITPTGISENSRDFVLMQQRSSVMLQVNGSHRDLVAEWYDISGRLLGSKAFGDVTEGSQLPLIKPDYQGLKLLRIITPDGQRVFKVF